MLSLALIYFGACHIYVFWTLAAERLRPTGGTADCWPPSFHATPMGLMLKYRIQPGARCPSVPPFRRLWFWTWNAWFTQSKHSCVQSGPSSSSRPSIIVPILSIFSSSCSSSRGSLFFSTACLTAIRCFLFFFSSFRRASLPGGGSGSGGSASCGGVGGHCNPHWHRPGLSRDCRHWSICRRTGAMGHSLLGKCLTYSVECAYQNNKHNQQRKRNSLLHNDQRP